MKLRRRDDYLELDKPIGEPNEASKYTEDKYIIQRSSNTDGTIIWYGLDVNWRLKDGVWSQNVYNELNNDYIWEKCDEPIYENLYKKLNKDE